MFDIMITPVTNKFQIIMQLYDKIKTTVIKDNNTVTFINNGSTDGLHQRSFHTSDKIFFIGSKTKTKDMILLNHALMRRNPEFTDNQYVVFLQPNTEVTEDYFDRLKSAIISNPDADVIFGQVDYKVKNKIKKDNRIQQWQDFTTKRNSGQLLKNFPPVREKTQKTNEKATEPNTLTLSDTKKTEIEIPEQNVSADFSSRSEEPSDAQNFQQLESISQSHDKNCQGVTGSGSDEKCHQSCSDKNCQCKNNFGIKIFNINKFYRANNICIKKDTLFKAGLLDIDYNFNQSCEIAIYRMINLFNIQIIYSDDFRVVETGKIRKHRPNNEAINNVNNFDFIYKDYIDKNVYQVDISDPSTQILCIEGDKSVARAIRSLVILTSIHNEELESLVRKQVSYSDKLVVAELPDNCSKKLQEIISLQTQYGESYDNVIVVNTKTKFAYPHFIDYFKRYSALMDYNGVLVSNRDFDVREITPGLAAEDDVSACFNVWTAFSKNVREASTLSEFLQKCSEQIDATGRGLVASFLPKPISKVPLMISERGEGGEVTPEVAVKHKSSWYDWME